MLLWHELILFIMTLCLITYTVSVPWHAEEENAGAASGTSSMCAAQARWHRTCHLPKCGSHTGSAHWATCGPLFMGSASMVLQGAGMLLLWRSQIWANSMLAVQGHARLCAPLSCMHPACARVGLLQAYHCSVTNHAHAMTGGLVAGPL